MKKLLLSALLLPLFTITTIACRCDGRLPSPYQAYHEAHAIFIGKVLSAENIPYEETIRDKKFTVYDRHFKFAVTEVLKGNKISNITINVGRIDSSCYRGFSIGDNYLVYADASNRKEIMFSAFCTRTSTLRSRLADVISIRAMLRGDPEPRLYGSLSRSDNDPNDPNASRVTYLSGITIVAESNGRQFSTITDKDGIYRFTKLAAGVYSVRPILPDKYMSYFPDSEEVTVARKSYGASADFWSGWNNQVEGRVLDQNGKAIRRAVVKLLSVDHPDQEMSPNFENISDYLGDEGKYKIYGKTPGRYILAVEVYAPFMSGPHIRRTYYPQTKERQNASIIDLGEADKLKVDLKLTSDELVHEIHGAVVWSDGTPVTKDAWFGLEKLEDSEDKNNVRYDLSHTDKQGQFKIQVFENAEYWLKVHVSTLGLKFGDQQSDLWDRGITEIKSTPIKIIGSKPPGPLKIILPLPSEVPKP